MKNYIIRVISLLLLLAGGNRLFAQQESTTNDLQKISENDQSAYLQLIAPHGQLIVNNYDLKYHRFSLYVNPAVNTIVGSVTSYFIATQTTMSSIQFELTFGMSADSAYHHGIRYDVNRTGKVINVPLGGTIVQGTLDSVTVYYHGTPTAGSYKTGTHGGIPCISTQSEPYGASGWWPSKNDLTDKIDSIDVYVVTPKGNHVASNGVLISETPYGENLILAHWKHRYPIASYLIAIASTNYTRFSDYLVTGNDSLRVLNYIYPEDSASLRNTIATVVPSIARFEELFGPYPFRNEKYGHAEYEFGGGMEHQTMTFMNKAAFNADNIAHELAHQWFGDMITCGSWHDIWLNEGFAVYCEVLRLEKLDPSHEANKIRGLMTSVTSQPGGSVYCDDTTNVSRIFDGRLTYCKSALLLHMLRWVMGDDKFFEGMRSYANDPNLQYGFARTSDFKAHMEAASGLDLTEFFADWFTGQGYPIYTVNIEQLPDFSYAVTINQSQSHNSVSFFEMPVPIKFLGTGKDTTIVFDHTFSGQVFNINPGFTIDSVKFDPDQRLVSANNEVSLGINDILAGKELKLMPNPAGDFLYVQNNPGKVNSIEILDMDGKKESVSLKNEDDKSVEINTQKLKPGMYLLRIVYNDGIVTRKFIKE
jgi:aminopeptidase N